MSDLKAQIWEEFDSTGARAAHELVVAVASASAPVRVALRIDLDALAAYLATPRLGQPAAGLVAGAHLIGSIVVEATDGE